MKLGRFFVGEKSIWHPYLVGHLRPHVKGFYTGPTHESQPRVPPRLTEVEVRCEVLFSDRFELAR